MGGAACLFLPPQSQFHPLETVWSVSMAMGSPWQWKQDENKQVPDLGTDADLNPRCQEITRADFNVVQVGHKCSSRP